MTEAAFLPPLRRCVRSQLRRAANWLFPNSGGAAVTRATRAEPRLARPACRLHRCGMATYLGFDVGTQSVKALLLDEVRGVLDVAAQPLHLLAGLPPGHSE